MVTKQEKRTYSVVAPVEMMKRLMYIAIEKDKSRSTLITEILIEYLKKNQQG